MTRFRTVQSESGFYRDSVFDAYPVHFLFLLVVLCCALLRSNLFHCDVHMTVLNVHMFNANYTLVLVGVLYAEYPK